MVEQWASRTVEHWVAQKVAMSADCSAEALAGKRVAEKVVVMEPKMVGCLAAQWVLMMAAYLADLRVVKWEE